MISVSSERQLFLDDLFFDQKENIDLVMHPPTPGEIVLRSDRSWESGGVHYSSVVQDVDRYRMWYRADTGTPQDSKDASSWICYAESRDGVSWQKPDLGIVESIEEGRNNILFAEQAMGINPSVILDVNAPADERYKMITRGSGPASVLAYVSSDGILWRPLAENPILSEPGPFDSHNILMYDGEKAVYTVYCRGTDTSHPGNFKGGRRAIRRSESPDFRTWTDLKFVVTPDDRDPLDLHIYTNAAVKYERAERSYLMFPMVLYVNRHVPLAPRQVPELKMMQAHDASLRIQKMYMKMKFDFEIT